MYGLTGAAVIFTFATLLFAVAAWWVSFDQAIKADAQRAKRPNPSLTFSFTRSSTEPDAEGRYAIFLEVYIVNYGTAPANNVHATLSFPASVVFQDYASVVKYGIVTSASPDYIELSPMIDSFGNRWANIHNRAMEVLPSEPLQKLGFGWFLVRPGPSRILWRVKCREGDFPGHSLDNVTSVTFVSE